MTLPTARTRTTVLLAGVLGAALTLTLAGCAGSTSSAAGTSVSAAAESSASPTSEAATFPVTIGTAYGEITVNQKPERIVALSGRHVELLNLLDEKPIAFTDYGANNEELLTSYPWMAGTYDSEPDPTLFTADYQPSPEAIAALKPDLILTTIWQTDERLYQQLSQIAPTYVGIETESNTTWQDDLTALAALTGHDDAVVAQTQAELDAKLAAAAERLPGLKDKTFYVAGLGEGEQLFLYYAAAPELIAMGLEPGEGQPVDGTENYEAASYSQENVDKLNADVLLVATEHRDPSGEFQAALKADPRVAELPASKNGTLIFFTGPEWNAVNGGSAVSVMWWLDRVVPVLEASGLNQS